MNESSVKLQAYLAHQGIASRRDAEVLISQGRVTVNGQIATIGLRIIPGSVKVKVDGQLVSAQSEEKVYYIINKPPGYLSTTNDELGRKTVLDLIPPQTSRLYPVGRLDKDSEGLMLLTNDGDLAYRLTHPKFETTKLYRVLVDGVPTFKALEFLRRGVKLKEGMTKPAEVTLLKEVPEGAWLEVSIHEGRYHQVRRMLERAGYTTVRLIRMSMGPLTMKDLHGKKYQQLSPVQAQELRASAHLP